MDAAKPACCHPSTSGPTNRIRSRYHHNYIAGANTSTRIIHQSRTVGAKLRAAVEDWSHGGSYSRKPHCVWGGYRLVLCKVSHATRRITSTGFRLLTFYLDTYNTFIDTSRSYEKRTQTSAMRRTKRSSGSSYTSPVDGMPETARSSPC